MIRLLSGHSTKDSQCSSHHITRKGSLVVSHRFILFKLKDKLAIDEHAYNPVQEVLPSLDDEDGVDV